MVGGPTTITTHNFQQLFSPSVGWSELKDLDASIGTKIILGLAEETERNWKRKELERRNRRNNKRRSCMWDRRQEQEMGMETYGGKETDRDKGRDHERTGTGMGLLVTTTCCHLPCPLSYVVKEGS